MGRWIALSVLLMIAGAVVSVWRGWVDVPADVEIVFDRDIESKWQRAFDLHRVDL